MFDISDYDSDVDIASPKYWHIKNVGFPTVPHIELAVSVSGSGLLEFFEDPTTSADGTALTAYNYNRNSSNTPNALFYYDPTVTVDGTRIDVQYIPGGDRLQTRVGSAARGGIEWVLDSEQYLLKFTPDADNTAISLSVGFYEESKATP
ncbi:MAG: hypothetical protein ACYTBJ_00110 [Planctomycetota bacterium]